MNRDTETQAPFDGAELEGRLSRFDELMEILPELASRIDKKELIRNIIKMVNELVNADHTHVRVIDWVEKKLVLEKYVKEEDREPTYREFSSVSDKKAICGRVFHSKEKEPEIIPDAQEDEDFKEYLKEVKNANLIKYLKKIGPAVVAPLLLDRKAIGVLTATRLRETENAQLPRPFTENDRIILEHFADYVAVALRNAWLFEAATWQPPQKDEKEKVVNLEMLCYAVVNEAMRRTGASNGRVRFVDWERAYLVPGALKWPDGPEPDPRVCVRKIGMCPAGVAAERRDPYLSNDLQNDPAFERFFDHTKACGESYQMQLEALKERQKSARSGSSLSAEAQHLKEGCPEIVDELEIRLNILAGLNYDQTKFANSLKKQIEVVERLSEAWREYVNHHLTKWNSEVAVPILLGSKLLGVLNVHSTEKDWFTDSDQAILQALTGRVALGVMEHQQEVLNKIQEIGQRMTASSYFDDMAELLAEGIKQVAFLIVPEKIFPLLYICKNPLDPRSLVDDKQHFGEMFDPQQRASATEDEIELLLNVPIRNDGLGWDAIKELAEKPDEPVFIVRENVDDPVSGGSPTAQEYGVMTTACIPLAFGRIVYGLLYIHINERHFFTELEKETLTLFAAQAAIVLKNLRRRSEEKTYDALCGDKLISECIKISA